MKDSFASEEQEREDFIQQLKETIAQHIFTPLPSLTSKINVTRKILEMIDDLAAWPTNASSNKDLKQVLRDVTEYAARNCCLHEETHRAGVLWEICDHCGMKWADDEGGMPQSAKEYPQEIKEAFVALGDSYNNG